MATVEQATADLIHTLGNFLAIVGESRASKEHGAPRMMDDTAIGLYALDKEPVLRKALDDLKQARAVAKIEDADEADRDYCSHCGQWKT